MISSKLLEEDEESEDVDMISCFCMHPNGKEVVVALRNFLLRHYVIGEKEPVRSIRGHRMPVVAMAYDPTGTLVATGSADKTVRVWDIPRGHCTHSFREHTDVVQMVQFHPSRLVLFSGSDDSTLRMYDLTASTCVACFRQHMSLPTALCFSEDGDMMVSSGRDQVLNFYNLQDKNTHLKTVPIMDELESVVLLSSVHSAALLGSSPAAGSAKAGAVSKKRAREGGVKELVLLTGGMRGSLRVLKISYEAGSMTQFTCTPMYELSTMSAHLKLKPSDNGASDSLVRSIKGITYVQEDSEIVLVTGDNNFCCYSIDSELKSLEWDRQVVGSCDDILDVVVIPGEAEEVVTAEAEEESDPDSAPAAEKDLKYRLAVVSNSALVQVIDSNQCSVPLAGHSDIVLAVDVTSDGKLLITSSKDRTCRVWDMVSMSNCAIAEGHTEAVGCVAISKKVTSYAHNQAFAVSGAGDKILKRWSVPVREFAAYGAVNAPSDGGKAPIAMTASHSVRAHDKDINTVAVAPNDSLVASGSQDHSIRIWKATDLSPLATLTGHKRGVWKVAFSPVDKSLASASGDRTVRLWSLNDNSCLRTFQGHTASVLNVKFANHGSQLISAASDGLINLWTIRTGDCEATLDAHEDKVWALGPVSDTHFISGGSDAKLILWKDVTADVEKDRLIVAEGSLLAEQELANDIRNKNYSKVLYIILL
jgi:U3 small nucleolar RNA-associated protein 13